MRRKIVNAISFALWVSIHAPREGCDLHQAQDTPKTSRFQFTHPGRGATCGGHNLRDINLSFNSRTPGGVRLAGSITKHNRATVSIHAPREGCDISQIIILVSDMCFNSRTPGGVRLVRHDKARRNECVSIHAPREGCDLGAMPACLKRSRFNSRTPGGVRLVHTYGRVITIGFQFTHPGRGATYSWRTSQTRSSVSIHAPREGCDLSILSFSAFDTSVSIHAPREGCDSVVQSCVLWGG